jgi:hypothetical protein
MDAPQLIGPRKKLFLRKGVIQGSTRSGVAAMSKPKRTRPRDAQCALYLCPVSVRAASMPNFRCCLQQQYQWLPTRLTRVRKSNQVSEFYQSDKPFAFSEKLLR